MNSDNLTQLLQQGFRVTLGATASFVETLQNPQKRTQNLDSLQSELSQLAQEWALKGEMTELEARQFVDNVLSQLNNQPPSSTPEDTATTTTTPPTQPSAPNAELEVQELTAQLAAIRAELEKLRNSDSNQS